MPPPTRRVQFGTKPRSRCQSTAAPVMDAANCHKNSCCELLQNTVNLGRKKASGRTPRVSRGGEVVEERRGISSGRTGGGGRRHSGGRAFKIRRRGTCSRCRRRGSSSQWRRRGVEDPTAGRRSVSRVPFRAGALEARQPRG